MAAHLKLHGLADLDNHLPGTKPSNNNEFMLVGTNHDGDLAELLAEAPGSIPASGSVARRGAGGHMVVPENATGQQAISAAQVTQMIADGPQSGVVEDAVADHEASSVTGLAVGMKYINTTDGKIYTVTSVTGGTTGDAAEWDDGRKPTTNETWWNSETESDWMFNPAADSWLNKGSAAHSQFHGLTSTSDHGVSDYKFGIAYTQQVGSTSDGAVSILPMVDGSGAPSVYQGAPLLSDGAGKPVFGGMFLAAAAVTCAGLVPDESDFTAWRTNMSGFAKTSDNKWFHVLKIANTEIVAVELS